MLVNPALTPSASEFLKVAYEASGQVRLDKPTPEEIHDAEWLSREHYIKCIASAEYVLLLKGWEYVERNRLVEAALLEETHRIVDGSLRLRSNLDNETKWREEMRALGTHDLTINRIQASLRFAGLI